MKYFKCTENNETTNYGDIKMTKFTKMQLDLINEIANREKLSADEVLNKFLRESFDELAQTNARIKENLGLGK